MDFEKELNDVTEITPMIDTKRPQTKGLRSGNTQYFTNIDGKYVKDAEARAELADVEEYVYGALEPWQPLQDGYSNFWFELSNDTLSPWLNFSAKTENAVIDWGDGSGEQALTTLTPTHTYSKAGRYVVKVKGVTGIAVQQLYAPYDARYFTTLKYIELNSDVSNIGSTAFRYYCGIKKVVTSSNLATIGYNAFINCSSLSYINLASSITTLQQGIFSSCFSLKNIILPSSLTTISATVFNVCSGLSDITIPELVTSIGNNAFNGCYSLSEIHCKPTTPPSLGASVFANLPTNFIIYVPVGTGDTYKSASGWSTYADHILEEGQTPNRMMLAKFNSAKTEESEVKDDELYKDENR